MKTYQVRRASASLGLFNERELRALMQKGKLLPTDEIDEGTGNWNSLGTFMAALPQAAASVASASARTSSAAQSPPMAGRHFYLHADGSRIGPLELSKITGMAQARLIDASARLEDVTQLGNLVPVGDHVPLPTPAVTATSPAPVASSNSPIAATSSTPPPVPVAAIKSKVSYLELWWKTTLWIYGIGAVFGYLAGNLDGFIVALVLGVLLAPIKGAFWAWIIWLFKR
jgi:hypothetical protein